MPSELNAPISAVTVYTNRARVTRSGSIDLTPGESTLVLSGLPAVVEADSVRVSGRGEGITIRGVDVKPDVQHEPESQKALQARFDDLRKQARALEDEHKALADKIDYFKALKVRNSEESGTALLNNETSFERVTAIADYIQEQLVRAYEQQRDVGYKLDAVNEQLKALQIRLAGNEPQQTTRGQAVHIAVEAEAAMTFQFDIEYLVHHAFWKPLYDVRLLEDNHVELTYMAQITQQTGEDWQEVALALSTARPALQSQLPKLSAWYVNDYIEYRVDQLQRHSAAFGDEQAPQSAEVAYMEPLAKRSLSALDVAGGLAGMAVGAVGAAVQAVLPQDRAVQVAQAAVASTPSGAIVTYTVGTPVTIPGSGEPHKTTITITGLGAELDYLTAPRLAPEAYLRATITNTSDYTLLPGEASVFHENDFVGKTQLETIAPSEEFKVQLGVDDRIKVERELVKRDTGTRFIGTKAQTGFEYHIKLTNLLPKKTRITVQDQFPLSKSNKINVRLDSARPEPTEQSDLHILTWELELAPEQQQTIVLAFTVEHGRNQTVYGLDD